MKKSQITIDIELNEDKHPEKIYWESSDSPSNKGKVEAKAMLLSLFDNDYKDTYKIDLWTSEMQVVEMDRFMFQTIKSLADTYYKATNNAKLASAMQQLADYMGKETGIIPKTEQA
jgi:gliding motility-associated protein GldC